MRTIKESVWGEIRKKSLGQEERIEDEMSEQDLKDLDSYIRNFADHVVFGLHRGDEMVTLDNFCDYIRDDKDIKISNKDKIIQYVKDFWADEIVDSISGAVEQAEKEWEEDQYGVRESVWGDIRKKSLGQEERMEDSIENLDMVGLYEYIKSHYELTNKQSEITYGTTNLAMRISNTGEEIYVGYGFGEVNFFFDLTKYPKLFDAVSKQFDVEPVTNSFDTHYTVSPKGERTNQFFIDVLDCVIANRKSFLRRKEDVNESVWGDLRKKSLGQEERIETDVNLLNPSGFCEYFKEHYSRTTNLPFRIGFYGNEDDGSIVVPVFFISEKTFEEISLAIPEMEVAILNRFDMWPGYIKRRLEEKYNIEDGTYKNGEIPLKRILPKEGETDNMFFLDVIDTILDTANKPFYKKKINESVWGDIRKKSLGQEDRIGDVVTYEDLMEDEATMEQLYNYLLQNYECLGDDEIKIEQDSMREGDDSITIPLSMEGENIYVEPDTMEIGEIYSIDFPKKYKTIVKRMGFFIEVEDDEDFNDGMCRGLQNGNVLKSDVVDFLENILKKVTNPAIRKRVKVNEMCDGVPGGATPASVGGMGAMYFPGPNGEPGSGDIPMPTGKVYQQVAPFGLFVKSIKAKKKRRKKFRKEDEPCVHSPNAKVYDYVDDYREYVDRTYNNMDRK